MPARAIAVGSRACRGLLPHVLQRSRACRGLRRRAWLCRFRVTEILITVTKVYCIHYTFPRAEADGGGISPRAAPTPGAVSRVSTIFDF